LKLRPQRLTVVQRRLHAAHVVIIASVIHVRIHASANTQELTDVVQGESASAN